jgi:4-alpha-glucanotransferase
VFALHPLYLRLQRLSDHIPDDIKEEIENFRQKLDLKDVDYEATLKAKLEIAKKMFHLEKDKVLNLPSFKQYFEENKVLYFSMKVL